MYELKHERHQIGEYLSEQMGCFAAMQESNGKFLNSIEPLSACLGFIGVRAGYYAAMKIVQVVQEKQTDPNATTFTLSSEESTLLHALADETLNFCDGVIEQTDDDLNDLDAPADAVPLVENNFYSTFDAILGTDDDDDAE